MKFKAKKNRTTTYIARNAVDSFSWVFQARQIEKNRILGEIMRTIWQTECGQILPTIWTFD